MKRYAGLVKPLYHDSFGPLLTLGLALATVMTSGLSVVAAATGGLALAACTAPVAVVLMTVCAVAIAIDRRLVRHFGTFGMNPVTARQVIAFVGARRWKERDPRVTLEFKNWGWPNTAKNRIILEEFERKLEAYKPRLEGSWPPIAMAIAYEATDRHIHHDLGFEMSGYFRRLDAVIESGADGKTIEQAILAFGAETGLEVASQGLPLDYARILYPDHVSHPSTQDYLNRYARA